MADPAVVVRHCPRNAHLPDASSSSPPNRLPASGGGKGREESRGGDEGATGLAPPCRCCEHGRTGAGRAERLRGRPRELRGGAAGRHGQVLGVPGVGECALWTLLPSPISSAPISSSPHLPPHSQHLPSPLPSPLSSSSASLSSSPYLPSTLPSSPLSSSPPLPLSPLSSLLFSTLRTPHDGWWCTAQVSQAVKGDGPLAAGRSSAAVALSD